MWLNIPFKDQLEMSRCIGSEKYDDAIRIINRGLTNSAKDAPSFEMIALCHHWASRDEAAIDAANQALVYDPKNFAAIKLLGSIYFDRAEHEIAAKYVRLGLECFPEPTPAVPRLFFRLLRMVGFLIPRIRKTANEAETLIGDPNKSNKEWYRWANEYLARYDQTGNATLSPTVH